MEIRPFLEMLLRRSPIVAVTLAATILAVIAAGIVIPPTYSAESTLRVLLDVGLTDLLLREDYNRRLLNTYAEVLTSESLLRDAINDVEGGNATLSVSQLQEQVTVEVIPDTEIIRIQVQDRRPSRAADLANAMSDLLIEYAQDLYTGSSLSTQEIIEAQIDNIEAELETDRQRLASVRFRGEDDPQVQALTSEILNKEEVYTQLLDRYETAVLSQSLRANSISVITPATTPHSPNNVVGPQEIVLGFVVGLVGGTGLAMLVENLDTKIRSSGQVSQSLDIPVLSTLPDGEISLEDLAGSSSRRRGQHDLVESYRLLGVYLGMGGDDDQTGQSLMITSSRPREGAEEVAFNLAAVRAHDGDKVTLIECDLRTPRLADQFQIGLGPTLHDLLSNQTSLSEGDLSPLFRPEACPNLSIIPAGRKAANAVRLLSSPVLKEIIDHLLAEDRVVIILAPPSLGFADSTILAPIVNAVLLVLKQGVADRRFVDQTEEQLKKARAKAAGVVFVQRN